MIKNMWLKKFLYSISYQGRMKKEIAIYKEKKDRYLAMSDEEFFIHYRNIMARGSYSSFSIVFATILTVAFTIISYWYFSICFKETVVSSNNVTLHDAEILLTVGVVIFVMCLILIISFLGMLINARRDAYKEKLFIEEMKAKRGVMKIECQC